VLRSVTLDSSSAWLSESEAKCAQHAPRAPCPHPHALCWLQGTKRIKYLEENVAAFQIKLSAEDLKVLDEVSKFTVGARYGGEVAKHSYDRYHEQQK